MVRKPKSFPWESFFVVQGVLLAISVYFFSGNSLLQHLGAEEFTTRIIPINTSLSLDENTDSRLAADTRAVQVSSLYDCSNYEVTAECDCNETLGTACCGGVEVDWGQVPPAPRPMPRLGNSWTFPTGPAYYSLADVLRDDWRGDRPPSGYPPFALMPPSFFDADWRYVEKVPFADRTFVERLKRMHINDCWLLGTGGQVWTRYMHETNSRLSEINNDYLLVRTRLWGDAWYGDIARLYGEYLWSDSFDEELPAAIIDANRGDILNLFVDIKTTEWQSRPVYVRVGRQELLFGSQRLVSALDWANTRRTFEGVRLLWQGEQWDFDMFWTQFVPPRAGDFDRADSRRDFAGVWLTHRPRAGHFVDLYYLYANHHRSVIEQGIPVAPLDSNTIGGRYFADQHNWLYEVETAIQFGRRNSQELLAGMTTAGIGRRFADLPWQPLWWVYYDWASGDSQPNSGKSTTFNQLFPFGHYYLGWTDLAGRQNIQDLNTHLVLFPNHWTILWLQYHRYWLDQEEDALYNAAGTAIRRDATGAAGNNVGDEFDIVTNVHVARYSDLLFGYSKLFGGSFLERTASGGRAPDSELFFLMFSQRW